MSESNRFWNVAPHSVRSNYPLHVRDHSLTTASGLLMGSLPYALARFGVQIAFTVAIIIWMAVAFGGAAWLGEHIASAFGVVWLVVCQVTLLFGFNALVRGVLSAFHNTLDWLSEMLPIPGLDSLAKILDIILRGATRYLDKVIFSYILARNDGDPGRDAREALVYYAQNANLGQGMSI
jgi:hypothetical protein